MSNIKVRYNPQKQVSVKNFAINKKNIALNELYDVSANEPQEGYILMYNEDSETWEGTNVITDNLTIDGGEY